MPVEVVVANEVVHRAVQGVGAALRDDVDVAAEGATEFGLAAGCDHLKLLDRVDAVRNSAESRRIVVGGETVDDEVVRQVALTGDRDALARHRGRFGKQLRAPDVGRRHSRNEQREIRGSSGRSSAEL